MDERTNRAEETGPHVLADALELFVDFYAHNATAAAIEHRSSGKPWQILMRHPLAEAHYHVAIRKRTEALRVLQRALSGRYFGVGEIRAYSAGGELGPTAEEIRRDGALIVRAARSLPAIVSVYRDPAPEELARAVLASTPGVLEVSTPARWELTQAQRDAGYDSRPAVFDADELGGVKGPTDESMSPGGVDDTDSLELDESTGWDSGDDGPEIEGVGRVFDPAAALEGDPFADLPGDAPF